MSKVASKYKHALSELEADIMKPNFKDINLAAFFKAHKLDTTLMSIFIRDKVFTKLGNGLYANNKPHEVQRLARSPSTALGMIKEYKLALEWKRKDNINRILIHDETDNEIPSDNEIGVIEQEQLQVVDSTATKTYGEEVVRIADKAFDEEYKKATALWARLFRGLSEYQLPKVEIPGIINERIRIDYLFNHSLKKYVKELTYNYFLANAKKQLDEEFEEFRKWKEAQSDKN